MKNIFTIFSDAGAWLEEVSGKSTVLDCTSVLYVVGVVAGWEDGAERRSRHQELSG